MNYMYLSLTPTKQHHRNPESLPYIFTFNIWKRASVYRIIQIQVFILIR